MSKNANLSGLIGRPVLIDWPVRWKDATDPVAAYKEASTPGPSNRSYYFGRTGEVVGTDPGNERGDDLVIKLDDGQVIQLYHGAVTITGPAPDPGRELRISLKRIEETLTQMLGCMKRMK
jgi:hypothetical protein